MSISLSALQQVASTVSIKSHSKGDIDFLIEVLRKLGADTLIDDMFTKSLGKTPDIPYSTTGILFLANLMCEQYPMYHISNMFLDRGAYDFKGTFGHDILDSQLNDDRFALFLDRLHEVGPRQFFTKLAINAMSTYDIKLQSVNYDTTSQIMWGAYDTKDGVQTSRIDITYGHSKQHRPDKNQIKMAFGVSGGMVVDGVVLSGSADDKTYNFNNMAFHDHLMDVLSSDAKDLYYIADSAAATSKTFRKAQEHGVKMITRLPDSYRASQTIFDKVMNKWSAGYEVIVDKVAHTGGSRYRVFEEEIEYDGVPLKASVCFSYPLMEQKTHKIQKRIADEEFKLVKELEKLSKHFIFACEEDASSHQRELEKTFMKKLKYHHVQFKQEKFEQPAAGRRPKDSSLQKMITKIELVASIEQNEKMNDVQSQEITKECLFVLVSNDLNISAENILREYKTQSQVEVKFRQLKAGQSMNSLFVKRPERVESLMYLYLIALQVQSIVEYVVRRGLQEDQRFIRGRGKTKQARPTWITIFEKFSSIGRTVISVGEIEITQRCQRLDEDLEIMLKYLKIPTEKFTGTTSVE